MLVKCNKCGIEGIDEAFAQDKSGAHVCFDCTQNIVSSSVRAFARDRSQDGFDVAIGPDRAAARIRSGDFNLAAYITKRGFVLSGDW